LFKLAEAQDAEGNSTLHACVLANQVQVCQDVLLALPRTEAVALLRRRNFANMLATDEALGKQAHEKEAQIGQAAQVLALFCQQFNQAEDVSVASAMGRGGAVRRRKGSDPSSGLERRPQATPVPMHVEGVSGERADDKAAAAAGDLLQLAAAATSCATGRARGSQSSARPRDAKPYQRRSAARGGRGGHEESSGDERDCWLPGGYWWHNNRTPMPSGRQPGELAGWTPLAGELNQQRLQDQREALSHKELFVQGLESRDDAAAYLQQLGTHASGEPGLGAARDSAEQVAAPITHSVDDSDISRSSTFRQLASWGGFRRHFKEEEGKEGAGPVADTPSSELHEIDADVAMQPGALPEEWKQKLQEQLLAKRAEVLATQKKLESLSLEQQELEMLFTHVRTR